MSISGRARQQHLAAGPSDFDEFMLGRRDRFPEGAIAGVRAFVAAGCLDCHGGPMMTDEKFHRVDLGSSAAATDPGRAAGIDLLLANPFNSRGPYYDQSETVPPALPDHAAPGDRGAFRTPSLRNLLRSAPYAHDGRFPSLFAMVRAHAPARTTDAQVHEIVAFLSTLNGALPPLPWANWPGT